VSTIAAPGRPPATSSRSASALNLIGGTWVEGRGNTSRDICNPADTAEILAPVREAAPAVAFYTRKKVITERWFGAEAPKDGWV
jgi:hypothetical protein